VFRFSEAIDDLYGTNTFAFENASVLSGFQRNIALCTPLVRSIDICLRLTGPPYADNWLELVGPLCETAVKTDYKAKLRVRICERRYNKPKASLEVAKAKTADELERCIGVFQGSEFTEIELILPKDIVELVEERVMTMYPSGSVKVVATSPNAQV
jgi:hypothetical protein